MTDAKPPAAVSARELVHRFGDRLALDHFSLDVPEGTVFGVLGPNGSGKSTFLTLLAAMEAPQEGEILVFGERAAPLLRSRVGTVFQENAQDPLMRVEEHLALAARLFGVPRATAASRASQLLESFGLAERRRDRIATLSGGMRRRLEAARALMHDPDLLVLDEPTTGVDAAERAALWDGIARERARTTIVATNDLAEADAVCGLVAMVSAGRVLVTGAPEDLKHGLRRDSVRLNWPTASAGQLAKVAGLRGVGTVTVDDDRVLVTVDDASNFVAEVFHMAPGEIRAVAIEAASLEDAYFRYVGQRSRDGRPAAESGE